VWNADDTRRHGPDVSIVSALGVTAVDISASGGPPDVPPQKKNTCRGCLLAKSLLAVALFVACFFYAIPKFASYSEV
jgi:hypothetical protein